MGRESVGWRAHTHDRRTRRRRSRGMAPFRATDPEITGTCAATGSSEKCQSPTLTCVPVHVYVCVCICIHGVTMLKPHYLERDIVAHAARMAS